MPSVFGDDGETLATCGKKVWLAVQHDADGVKQDGCNRQSDSSVASTRSAILLADVSANLIGFG
ncbi:MAG TPA: hypothetical protein DDZ51_29185 [Planctomycetaceae bacterium]|nr:hypothetical protein [Planctomycetaceae bacterium]